MKFSVVFLFLLFLSCLASADSSAGDEAFLIGDYEQAESFYSQQLSSTRDPALQRRILLKLMGVAQARGDLASVASVGGRLDEALQGVDDPEVAMRMYLIRGVMAMRTTNYPVAVEAYTKARPPAQALYEKGDPGGALGLAECNSFNYMLPIFTVGRPTPAEYQEKCKECYSPTYNVYATADKPLWFMDVTRTAVWNRFWVWKAFDFYWNAYLNGEQELANEWAATSQGIGLLTLQAWQQSYPATKNRELLVASFHVMLELTESFALTDWAPDFLNKIKAGLAQWPETAEKNYIQGRYYRSMARRALALKEFDRALEFYHLSSESLQKAKRTLESMDMMVELAYAHVLSGASGPGWSEEVPGTLERLLKKCDEIQYPLAHYYGLGFLGTLKAREGKLEEAESLLKEAMVRLEEWSEYATPAARAQQLSRREVRLFNDTLVEVLLKQKKEAEAMELVGRLGAMSEVAGVDLGRVRAKDPQTSNRLRSVQRGRQAKALLMSELSSAQVQGDQAAVDRISRQLADNKADFQKTVNELRRDDPDFERLVSIRPSSFARLQKVLPADVVLVGYYPGADRTLLFALTKETSSVFSSNAGRKELDTLIGRVRRGFLSGSEDTSALAELHDILISPIQSLLQDKAVLAIVPSGQLYYLPFAALKAEGGEPLVKQIGLSVLTATELPDVATFAAGSAPAHLLALADPDGSLPGAQAEVDRIAALFSDAKVYRGEEATQDKVQGNGDVLHLATHGTLDSLDTNESYLLVSGGDHKLTVGEIYGLELDNVSLVTLSACQTALGEFNPGAEIATLSQAFSVAGSRSMLGSLWKVDDRATAFLMEHFYTHLTSGKSKSEALRLAQLETSAEPDFENPYFWSGFILLGDWH